MNDTREILVDGVAISVRPYEFHAVFRPDVGPEWLGEGTIDGELYHALGWGETIDEAIVGIALCFFNTIRSLRRA